MTNIEEFQADIAYNKQHPVFAPYDDDMLGQRFSGGFEKTVEENGNYYKRWFFDNGNNYTLDLQTNLFYVCDPIPPDYFIHKWIEKSIYDIIVKNTKVKLPEIFCVENEIKTVSNPLIIIRVLVFRDNKSVCVTNIHVMDNMRHHGYGKLLLKEIFANCKKLGYRLFLTEMLHSFYESMVARGSKIIEFENVVEITDQTILD